MKNLPKIALGAWAWGDSVVKMCEASLERMNMEYFDIYWIHNPIGAPATSGGSGLGETSRTLQEVVPGASVKEGRMLNGRLNVAELKQWAGKNRLSRI